MNARDVRIGVLVLVLTVAAACGAPATGPTASGAPAVAANADVGGDEQQHEAGSVTVRASWIVGTSSARVALDTHSVDLDGFDLTALAMVRVDGGDWIAATGWDAPKGGHHRSGTLRFDTLAPDGLASAHVIELEIRDVAASSHLLRWERRR